MILMNAYETYTCTPTYDRLVSEVYVEKTTIRTVCMTSYLVDSLCTTAVTVFIIIGREKL